MRILLTCPDRPGVVAKVSGFLAERDLNIRDLDQHSSKEQLFMRVVIDQGGPDLEQSFAPVAAHLQAEVSFSDEGRPRKLAVLGSAEPHCLQDILFRSMTGELGGRVCQVASTEPDSERWSEGLPFMHLDWARGPNPVAEARLLEWLDPELDLLVLARFMRILSADFLAALPCPAINIHHSFLPAFAGANPYGRAWERGVKLIGATAHYVTEALDEGPIIAQETRSVTHRDEAVDMVRLGRDLERQVLARAVRDHLADRVILDGARTIVF